MVSDIPVSVAPAVTESSSNIQSLLNERIDMYKTAEANAQASGDTSKARR